MACVFCKYSISLPGSQKSGVRSREYETIQNLTFPEDTPGDLNRNHQVGAFFSGAVYQIFDLALGLDIYLNDLSIEYYRDRRIQKH